MKNKFFNNLPWKSLPIILFIGLILIQLHYIPDYIPENAVTLLEFNRDMIANGDIWQVITGHLIHNNANHLYMNALGLLALWLLHGQYYQARLFINHIVISACFISACLYFLYDTQIYVGFSGVLHSLIVWGAFKDIEKQEKTGYILLVGIILKLLWEQFMGASPSMVELIGTQVATEAHLMGAIIGCLIFYQAQP